MRYILATVIFMLSLSACASKSGVSDKEYYRANSASEKSLDKLDRE